MSNNIKNIEVEVRALLEDLTNTEKKVISAGGKKLNDYKIHDIYFCKKDINDLSGVEMNKVGSYGLRIRKMEGPNSTISTINTKTIIEENDHNAWREHEVEIKDFKGF